MPATAALGVLLTKWTIRLALVCYVTYLGGWLTTPSPRWPHAARWIWTIGCGLFLVHVACAFHTYHHWSHAAAWSNTAEQTRQLIGVAFGDGIYFNYSFLVLWVLDVVWLWLTPATQLPPRLDADWVLTLGSPAARAASSASRVPRLSSALLLTPWWRVLVHVFLFFIAVNGAIVFKPGPIRWVGIGACLTLGCLAVRRAYNSLLMPQNRLAREMVHEEGAASRDRGLPIAE